MIRVVKSWGYIFETEPHFRMKKFDFLVQDMHYNEKKNLFKGIKKGPKGKDLYEEICYIICFKT